ncbi:uncharacterized protein LAESUDRAFT_76133 [Laetiporus sulphureus 93-53]|uniref:Uncharacterized protein n=1 Tax=Laetiporus sulphureus 93-53 TaxID=1314785 RepID=A0A165F0M2_9APHY|nr:uncharacterized protein LAESUDRAFT_76133 [Laetiporus sulphureus 93-53]KZT08112.1 hypothetical protein LAESUDRAFT_76133 [Laetiporus sulphureus 93-53]
MDRDGVDLAGTDEDGIVARIRSAAPIEDGEWHDGVFESPSSTVNVRGGVARAAEAEAGYDGGPQHVRRPWNAIAASIGRLRRGTRARVLAVPVSNRCLIKCTNRSRSLRWTPGCSRNSSISLKHYCISREFDARAVGGLDGRCCWNTRSVGGWKSRGWIGVVWAQRTLSHIWHVSWLYLLTA